MREKAEMTEAIWVALIMAGLGVIGSAINGYFHVRSDRARKSGNNPHPCGDHAKQLKELDDKIDAICERISRIEGRLNGLWRPGK